MLCTIPHSKSDLGSSMSNKVEYECFLRLFYFRLTIVLPKNGCQKWELLAFQIHIALSSKQHNFRVKVSMIYVCILSIYIMYNYSFLKLYWRYTRAPLDTGEILVTFGTMCVKLCHKGSFRVCSQLDLFKLGNTGYK